MKATAIKVDNGVNVEALLGARQALTEAELKMHQVVFGRRTR